MTAAEGSVGGSERLMGVQKVRSLTQLTTEYADGISSLLYQPLFVKIFR